MVISSREMCLEKIENFLFLTSLKTFNFFAPVGKQIFKSQPSPPTISNSAFLV